MDDDFVEIPDPNLDGYEPSEQEIQEYAEWLGADLNKDQDLFYIAKEALKAPIPQGWKLYQRKDGTGEAFYFNSKTGESLWDHPLDSHYKELFKEKKREKEMNKSKSKKEDDTAQKEDDTVQKEDDTVQKEDDTIQKEDDTVNKMRDAVLEHFLDLLDICEENGMDISLWKQKLDEYQKEGHKLPERAPDSKTDLEFKPVLCRAITRPVSCKQCSEPIPYRKN